MSALGVTERGQQRGNLKRDKERVKRRINVRCAHREKQGGKKSGVLDSSFKRQGNQRFSHRC